MRSIAVACIVALLSQVFIQSGGLTPAAQVAKPANAGGAEPSKPVAITAGTVTLTPENTRLQFVGTHVGPKPDPMARTGDFTKFSGKAEVDPKLNTLKSVSVEIKTESVETPIQKLTNHLRSPDFFDARAFPAAKFESSSIMAGKSPGDVIVTGRLTLLKATKEVKFPAKVTVNDKGFSLTAQFVLDRTEFGMTGLQEMVNKEITVSVVVGK